MIIVCVLMVIIAGIFGYTLSGRFVKKEKFYKDLVEFCSYLEANISFSKEVINNLIKRFDTEKSTSFSNYLLNYFEKTSVNSNLAPEFLSKNELLEVNGFLNNIGTLGAEEQIQQIVSYKKLFDQKLQEVSKTKNKNSSLYFKLSISVGLVVAIIIY